MTLALRGNALELLQTVPEEEDYPALVKVLERRFGDEHLHEMYRMQLKTRRQKQGENLQELEADVKR